VGAARIRYTLPADAASVTLAVYDLSGRRVRTLVDGPIPAGSHEAFWNGMSDSGNPAPAGVYFYRLAVGRETAVRKLAFMR
jgi:flagellar hook assembly protein FlgD